MKIHSLAIALLLPVFTMLAACASETAEPTPTADERGEERGDDVGEVAKSIDVDTVAPQGSCNVSYPVKCCQRFQNRCISCVGRYQACP